MITSSSTTLFDAAAELARDGEIGNSDAIHLLQLPHNSEDLREILQHFDMLLTPQARGKLTLAAYTPLPAGVQNQRYEALFDRYPISGRTYTTARGDVVLREVQYYNGRMVQVYGECANLDKVASMLSGSGYQPLRLRYRDGRETAVAQCWAHQLSDTSLGPYDAMFVIVLVMPSDASDTATWLWADTNGASSAVAMAWGRYDECTGRYENRARLYYARLLDSTRIAIDVGRERMGTDKRPGTVQLKEEGGRVVYSVRDGSDLRVARFSLNASTDPCGYLSTVRAACATAGVEWSPLPAGTEYIYPCVARIGSDPGVQWDWRSDLVPRLRPAQPDTAQFFDESEVGRMLIDWEFTPKVWAYIPNVRGVVTGIPEPISALKRQLRVRMTSTDRAVLSK